MLHDFKAPVDAMEAEDGSLLVLELGTGSLLRVKGADGKDRTDDRQGAECAGRDGQRRAMFMYWFSVLLVGYLNLPDFLTETLLPITVDARRRGFEE